MEVDRLEATGRACRLLDRSNVRTLRVAPQRGAAGRVPRPPPEEPNDPLRRWIQLYPDGGGPQ